MVRAETDRLVDRIRQLGLPTGAVLLNRATTGTSPRPSRGGCPYFRAPGSEEPGGAALRAFAAPGSGCRDLPLRLRARRTRSRPRACWASATPRWSWSGRGFGAVIGRPETVSSADALERNCADVEWMAEQGLLHEQVVAWFVDHAAILPSRLLTLFSGQAIRAGGCTARRPPHPGGAGALRRRPGVGPEGRLRRAKRLEGTWPRSPKTSVAWIGRSRRPARASGVPAPEEAAGPGADRGPGRRPPPGPRAPRRLEGSRPGRPAHAGPPATTPVVLNAALLLP
jgi:hypothetical protein